MIVFLPALVAAVLSLPIIPKAREELKRRLETALQQARRPQALAW
jgi:hypothetical protein